MTTTPYPARIGSDLMLDTNNDEYFTLDGYVYGRWSAGVVAGFKRHEAEQYARFDNWMMATTGGTPRFTWDGDTLVFFGTEEAGCEDACRIEPNDAGHYIIGDGWVWDEEPIDEQPTTEVDKAIRMLHESFDEVGGWHYDDGAANMIDAKTGKPTFTPERAAELDHAARVIHAAGQWNRLWDTCPGITMQD